MPRKKHAAHENHERWLVSYADFITLLFAFFVVMFATSQSDKKAAKAVSESVRDALEHGQVSAAISKVLGRPQAVAVKVNAKPDDLPGVAAATAGGQGADPLKTGVVEVQKGDLTTSLEKLQQALAAELKAGKLNVTLEPRGLVISLREATFFASGNDVMNSLSYPAIQKVAAVINGLPNAVRLEGHTDSMPIHNSRFRSNWELSAARAIAMLEILAERCAVPRGRMAIAGYAETAPTDTNDTPDGRARNRRVDVVILTEGALQSEPPQHSGAPARQPAPEERGGAPPGR